ncbi:hypothetical protein [Nocardioides perillae]|uniref:Uncharacterized protein n=1 Tax=Nocardioides perillae TaxID=1119534 RepID=A0A7Y9USN1_9ACTN|nr:hypothetical protein [Nocardioides perillae]NYG56084.1 hypothetical protein [Nocardioides perillae]
MTAPGILAVTALAVACACLLTLAATVVTARRAAARGRAETAALRRDLAELRAALGTAGGGREVPPEPEPDPADAARPSVPAYVITGVGDRPRAPGGPAPAPARLEGRLFADLVLRESVVKAAALAHGVRRAAAPETRDRVRVELRRELRRARKQRRADLRAARRHLHAEQRADLAAGEDAA